VTNHICNTQQLKHKISRFPTPPPPAQINIYIDQIDIGHIEFAALDFCTLKCIGNSFQAAAVASA
jgi:hypothetical protein